MRTPARPLGRFEDIRPSKGLGQNFLVDQNIARKIVDAVQVTPDLPVLEIGPGTGALTRLLVEDGADVTAIEIDLRLKPLLEETLGDRARLIFQDALEGDWEGALGRPMDGVTVVSNLPYAITSPLLVKLLRSSFKRAVLMMQEEVAERILAPSGARARGSLTLLVESRAAGRCLFRVGPQAFHPKPKVSSAVVELRPVTRSLHPLVEDVWKGLFAYRRKSVRKGLREAFGVGPEEASHVLGEAGVAELARPEELTLDAFDALARAIHGRA